MSPDDRRGPCHAHRSRPALRDGGGRDPGHPHPHVEARAGQPPRRPGGQPSPRRPGVPRLRGRDADVRASTSAAAAHLATILRDRFGVQPGDRVAIAMRNYPEWSVAFWAATVGRCRRRAAERLVDRARAGVRAGRLRLGRRLRGRRAGRSGWPTTWGPCPTLRAVIVAKPDEGEGPLPDGALRFDDVLGDVPADAELPDVDRRA